jgi:uncharacterized protein YegJ (DUF2314 family)
MKKIIIILILINVANIGSAQLNKKERANEPDIYSYKGEDKKMNEAIDKAKNTFDNFIKILEANEIKIEYSSIKMKFKSKDGHEYIWLDDIELNGDQIIGKIGNVPDQVDSIKIGDKIIVEYNRVADWFYVSNGLLHGGYTIRVLRDKMNAKQRKEFDKQYHVQFD